MRPYLLLGSTLLVLTGFAPTVFSQTAPELARVPANAALVIHLQAATLYSSPGMVGFRELLAKAGPKAIRVFEERFQPGPNLIDRITLVAVMPPLENFGGERSFALMVTTFTEVKPDHLAEKFQLEAELEPNAAFPTWVEKKGHRSLALALPHPKLILFGTKAQVLKMAKDPKDRYSPFDFRSLEKYHFAMVANTMGLPPEIKRSWFSQVGWMERVNTIRLTAMVEQKATLEIQGSFNSEGDAIWALANLKKLVRDGVSRVETQRGEFLDILNGPKNPSATTFAEFPEAFVTFMKIAGLNHLQDFLETLPIQREGKLLTAQFTLPLKNSPSLFAVWILSVAFLEEWILRINQPEASKPEESNLKGISLAIMNYHDTFGRFPTDILDPKTNKPLLSWRVSILPFLDEDKIYNQFKLNEPWDSENNRKLAKTLVKLYHLPNQKNKTDAQGNHLTHYMFFSGNGSLFHPGKKMKLNNITDGSSNTILCVEAKSPCIWTKPQDLPFDSEKEFPPPETILGLTPAGFHASFCDGVVRWFPIDLDRKTLKQMIIPNDGKPAAIP